MIIFDEYFNALILRDFESDDVETLFKNCHFGKKGYYVLSDYLLAFEDSKLIEGEKV